MLPALDGASIAGIVPALFGRVDNSWIPGPALEADAVVLLVLDGLGWSALQDHAAEHAAPRHDDRRRDHDRRAVDHGDRAHLDRDRTRPGPARHRRLPHARGRPACSTCCAGRVRAAAGSPSRTTCSGTRPSSDARCRWSRGRSSARRGSTARTSAARASPAGTRRSGSWSSACGRSRRGSGSSTRTTRASTRSRTSSASATACSHRELAFADRLVGDLVDALPASAAVLVTSDHGQVHLDAESWIDVPELGAMSAAMAGDGRFRYLYAPPGGGRELLARARELVSDRAWVWSRAELLEMGVFGAGAGGTVAGRIGNVVLAAGEPVAFVGSRAAERADAAIRPRQPHPRRDVRAAGRRARRPPRPTRRAAPRSPR